MNFKNLFAVSLAALTLLSCTKEIIKEVPIDGGRTETGDTYVKFTLDANMVKTRATADHDGLTPTSDEDKIYNYALFIFKSNGMLEATLLGQTPNFPTPISPDGSRLLYFDKALNNELDWNEDEDAIRISAGAKTFFAIVNAPYEFVDPLNMNNFVNNTSLTLTELKEITLTLGLNLNKIVGGYNNGNVALTNPVSSGDNRGFMMTNIIADGQSDSFRRMTLEEREEDDPMEVTVTVGRAMAKVSVASDLQPFSTVNASTGDPNQKHGVLDTKEYKIINNPNKMNVALNLVSGIVMTPYISAPTTNITTANYFYSNNDEINSTHPGESYYIPVSTSAAKTFNYCIENSNLVPRYGNAAIALIKGNYTPLTTPRGQAVILDANSNILPADPSTDPNPLQPGNDFYRIWIKPYTDSNGDPQGGVYAPEYFTASPVLDDYRTFKGWPTNSSDPDYAELEVYLYEEGLCYYYLPLYNEDSNDPYTVVRNSYYRIDIKSVDGAGHPEDPDNPGEPGGPDKPDPVDPLEPQTYLQATIKVANWDAVDQTGNL